MYCTIAGKLILCWHQHVSATRFCVYDGKFYQFADAVSRKIYRMSQVLFVHVDSVARISAKHTSCCRRERIREWNLHSKWKPDRKSRKLTNSHEIVRQSTRFNRKTKKNYDESDTFCGGKWKVFNFDLITRQELCSRKIANFNYPEKLVGWVKLSTPHTHIFSNLPHAQSQQHCISISALERSSTYRHHRCAISNIIHSISDVLNSSVIATIKYSLTLCRVSREKSVYMDEREWVKFPNPITSPRLCCCCFLKQ